MVQSTDISDLELSWTA